MAQAEHLPQEKEEILKRLCDSLECSICLEQYTDPRVLNCQHSFCAKCLKEHVGVSDILRCPLCNNESAKPAEGIDSLQSNFFIKGLIEDVIGIRSELQEELKPKRKCGSCDEGNDVISYCEECQSDLCADCMDMHKKMKALKDHNVTPLPTQEELLEEVKIKSDDMIEKIAHDIYDEEAELNEKISSLKNKIGIIEKKRDSEKNKLRESHRQLLEKIDEYVQQLTTKINSSAAERLGDMPEELVACEQQLKTYKTLKQQGWIIRNIQIHTRIQRCQELMKQLSDFQQRSHASVYHGGNEDVVAPAFVEGVADQSQVMFGLVRCLGYLRPIPSRCVVYVNLRQDSGAGQTLTTGKQRQEMRNREESIAGLRTQDLSILNKQLQGLIQEHKCKTALIVDMLQTLERKYEHSKQYSAVRRYRMLKSIVKAVIHNQWLQE